MRAIRVFVLGFIFGVYLKWIIDQIYTRDHLWMITNENTQLRDRIQLLEEARSAQRINHTPEPSQPPAPAAARKPARRTSTKDDLKKIKGIGPAMEKKLNAAGINTYEQFSRLTSQQLQSIPGISRRVVESAGILIAQAKKLAQPKS